MGMNFPRPAAQQIALGASSSGATSTPWLVCDFASLSISIQTSGTSASRVTVLGSNADGFVKALDTASASGASGSWSVLTAITNGQGVYTIDRGARWIQVTRPDFAISAASAMTVILSGSY